jgi:cytochrome b involved in lipid metabolism
MAPQAQDPNSKMTSDSATNNAQEQYTIIYKGVEYDATDFAAHHPGGIAFLNNFKNDGLEGTAYFRSLHSKQALKTLKSLKKTGRILTESE